MSDQSGTYQPPGPPPIVFEGFSTLNTQAARPSIDDDQCSVLDGFMPVSKSTVRTMPGVGTPIFTDVNGVAWFDFGNIGNTPICFIIGVNGSIWQVNTETLAVTAVAAPGTVYAPTAKNFGITQWGSTYILLISEQLNGYWAWDGTTFYGAGMSLPGQGTMPTGISGTAIETYAGRVWVATGPTMTFSAPQSVVDFSSGSGGGTFQTTDSFLRVQYTQPRQTNGFLYLIGDSSINYISGVTSSGSPVSTTFSNQNADPEIGTGWASTVDVFSRNIVFANSFGAHISYGGAVTKISDALDGIWPDANILGGFMPSAAKAIVYGQRIWCLLLRARDPLSDTISNRLFCWNGKKWWTTIQDHNLVYVQHQEFFSDIKAYGTDGNTIWPLFQTPTTGFVKTIQSKLFAKPGGWEFQKSADRIWGLARYHNASSPGINVTIDNESGSSSNVIFNPTLGTLPETIVFPAQAVAQNGVLLGMTVYTPCADVEFLGMSLSPQIPQYRG